MACAQPGNIPATAQRFNGNKPLTLYWVYAMAILPMVSSQRGVLRVTDAIPTEFCHAVQPRRETNGNAHHCLDRQALTGIHDEKVTISCNSVVRSCNGSKLDGLGLRM